MRNRNRHSDRKILGVQTLMVNKPFSLVDIRNTMAYMLGAIIGINLMFWTIVSIALHNVKRAIQTNKL